MVGMFPQGLDLDLRETSATTRRKGDGNGSERKRVRNQSSTRATAAMATAESIVSAQAQTYHPQASNAQASIAYLVEIEPHVLLLSIATVHRHVDCRLVDFRC